MKEELSEIIRTFAAVGPLAGNAVKIGGLQSWQACGALRRKLRFLFTGTENTIKRRINELSIVTGPRKTGPEFM